jgi:hypothetical protein
MAPPEIENYGTIETPTGSLKNSLRIFIDDVKGFVGVFFG